MVQMVPGIDASMSRITAATFRRFRAELGCKVFVQCGWTGGYKHNKEVNAVAEGNLYNAASEGYANSLYVNAQHWWEAKERSFPNARINAGSMWDSLISIPIDVEIAGTKEKHIKAHVVEARGTGKKVCIYTAHWFWHTKLGNPSPSWITDWNIDLWNAFHDKNKDIDFGSLPFGPWALKDVVGEQYTGSTKMFGAEVDLNTFRSDFWLPGSVTIPPVPDDGAFAELESRVGVLEGVVEAHVDDPVHHLTHTVVVGE